MDYSPTQSLLETPKRLRLTPEVAIYRKTSAYTNYPSPLLLPHGHPQQPITTNIIKTWTGPKGFGARHQYDDAPFSLWNSAAEDFRFPTSEEEAWLCSQYPDSRITFRWPTLIIETNMPPNPLPLTVAGVAAKYVPPPEVDNVVIPGLVTDNLPIQITNDYMNMKSSIDPLPFRLTKWKRPTSEQQRAIVDVISNICNPHYVHVLFPYIIVELYEDGRCYGAGSLPRTIGGCSAVYHHQKKSIFEGMTVHGVPKLIQPSANVQDTSDYLQAYHVLNPGVRVSSAQMTNIGQWATVAVGTTAGILLRNNHGQQRLTVAHHGFLHSDDIYHPTEAGTNIGVIDERFEHLDVALAKLNPSINYDNSTYFESKRPRRLLRHDEIELGAWFSIDGVSTGLVSLRTIGITMEVPPRPPGTTKIRYTNLNLFDGFGQMNTILRNGICGAAIVEENVDDGGVAGFFHLGNGGWALSPCLDELIDRSWSVV
ncbi:MAG: hypothetical protein Q9178_005449 [Gyalolechia marmorata]